ncbi:hypothetical protein [Colwellia sp. E2M01]|uniref:hypothetical protein n=1 Tax=Colwellia sp. E2M01 TaxID=2841561 RepID=UPI001C097DAD|nr:hypothetical protein [Colwellia sp. E2M01]MBU2871530.1 hypothetical protein [Colwellia sp. E2M01]
MNMLKTWRGKTVAVVGASFAVVGSSHAALDSAQIDAIKAEVLADVTLAVAAGFAILAVVLASTVGMSLLSRFINKGANG